MNEDPHQLIKNAHKCKNKFFTFATKEEKLIDGAQLLLKAVITFKLDKKCMIKYN